MCSLHIGTAWDVFYVTQSAHKRHYLEIAKVLINWWSVTCLLAYCSSCLKKRYHIFILCTLNVFQKHTLLFSCRTDCASLYCSCKKTTMPWLNDTMMLYLLYHYRYVCVCVWKQNPLTTCQKKVLSHLELFIVVQC